MDGVPSDIVDDVLTLIHGPALASRLVGAVPGEGERVNVLIGHRHKLAKSGEEAARAEAEDL